MPEAEASRHARADHVRTQMSWGLNDDQIAVMAHEEAQAGEDLAMRYEQESADA